MKMKNELLLAGLVISISASISIDLYASDIPCNIIGTAKDPNLIKLIEMKPGDINPEESILSYKDQYKDALRCGNKADAARFKKYYEGIEAATENDQRKKTASAKTPIKEDQISSTLIPKIDQKAVVKKITIQCEDQSTKPKTIFKIEGTDSNGAVIAEGFKDQMLVRLMFDNRKPELGRTIEVIVNGESNKLSLHPGLGPIGFKPGFAMKLLLKAMGISSDIKINCMPLTQKDFVEPSLEVTPTKIVDDSSRGKKASEVLSEIEAEEEKNQESSSTATK